MLPASAAILFQNKSILVLSALSLQLQPNVFSNAFLATKSLTTKMISLYVSITTYQFLCLVAPVTYAITFFLLLEKYFSQIRLL